MKDCSTWTGRCEAVRRHAYGSIPAGQHVPNIAADLGPAKPFLSSPLPGSENKEKAHHKTTYNLAITDLPENFPEQRSAF